MEQKEIVYEVGRTLENNGYKIEVLDLNTMKSSGHFNIFDCIKTETDVDRVLKNLPRGTKKSEYKWIKELSRNLLRISKFSDKEKAQILKRLDIVVVTEQPNSNSSENKKESTQQETKIGQKRLEYSSLFYFSPSVRKSEEVNNGTKRNRT